MIKLSGKRKSCQNPQKPSPARRRRRRRRVTSPSAPPRRRRRVAVAVAAAAAATGPPVADTVPEISALTSPLRKDAGQFKCAAAAVSTSQAAMSAETEEGHFTSAIAGVHAPVATSDESTVLQVPLTVRAAQNVDALRHHQSIPSDSPNALGLKAPVCTTSTPIYQTRATNRDMTISSKPVCHLSEIESHCSPTTNNISAKHIAPFSSMSAVSGVHDLETMMKQHQQEHKPHHDPDAALSSGNVLLTGTTITAINSRASNEDHPLTSQRVWPLSNTEMIPAQYLGSTNHLNSAGGEHMGSLGTTTSTLPHCTIAERIHSKSSQLTLGSQENTVGAHTRDHPCVSPQGLHPSLREIRKSIAKDLVSLQEKLDYLGSQTVAQFDMANVRGNTTEPTSNYASLGISSSPTAEPAPENGNDGGAMHPSPVPKESESNQQSHESTIPADGEALEASHEHSAELLTPTEAKDGSCGFEESIAPCPETPETDLRYQIILGSAQGIAYLHHDCLPPIVHRDIKANNILIGLNFEPYIADFGLAKLVEDREFGRCSNTVAGSYGYIAPEYGYSMKITEKSDVYSYGVVMLEVLTGKQPIDPTIPDGVHLVDWVRRRKGSSEVLDLVLQWPIQLLKAYMCSL